MEILLPQLPLANAGTPLMWLGCCWPFFGNFFLGAIETWLLLRIGKVSAKPANALYWANFASAVAGVGLVYVAQSILNNSGIRFFPIAREIIAGMWTLAFLLTLVVEVAFFAKCLGVRPFSVHAWRVTTLVNAITYVPLIALANVVSFASLPMKTTVVDVRTMEPPAGWVYYVESDGWVNRIRLDGTRKERVVQAPKDATILLRPRRDASATDLIYERSYDDWPVLSRAVAKAAQAAPVYREEQVEENKPRPMITTHGSAFDGWLPDFRAAERRELLFGKGFWPAEGIFIRSAEREILIGLTLETPFWLSAPKLFTILPDDRLVWEINGDIVLLDPRSFQIAKIGRGTQPRVLLDAAVAPRWLERRAEPEESPASP